MKQKNILALFGERFAFCRIVRIFAFPLGRSVSHGLVRGTCFGLMAEWLGKGLQNLVQRFESASDLTKTALQISVTLFSFCFVRYLYGNRKNECKDYAFFIVGIF